MPEARDEGPHLMPLADEDERLQHAGKLRRLSLLQWLHAVIYFALLSRDCSTASRASRIISSARAIQFFRGGGRTFSGGAWQWRITTVMGGYSIPFNPDFG